MRKTGIMMAALLLLLSASASSFAQTIPGTNSRTFEETGKTVTGIFLDYWQEHGGLSQQGFPISNLMSELSSLDGKSYTVQYFERAVFEYHPEEQPPYNVLLSQLGTFRYKQEYPEGAPGQVPNNSAGSRLFTETGHRVGGKFLSYWEANGGLPQQGFPISDEFTELSALDGKTYTVQYFERAVFEYHPENPAPYDVLLSQLGTFQYRQNHEGYGPVEGSFDVGGYKLWISCKGQGSPTVIMDAALGTGASQWVGVQPSVSEATRACVYDRANIGKSDAGPAPRTSAQMMKELYALLTEANVKGPYVLVGGAEGGLNMQLFAKLHKEETVGLVLVDAVHPDLDARYQSVLTPEQDQLRQQGISSTRDKATYADTHLSGQQVKDAGPLPVVPTIVLRHGLDLPQPPDWPVEAIERIWLQMQEELAAMVPGAKLIVAENSRHFIQISEPDLVINSIKEVVEAARKQ